MINVKKIDRSWMRFNRYIYRYWKVHAVIIFLSLIVIPLGLVNPYLTKLVIDKAYGQKDLQLFFILAIIGGVVFIITGFINSLSGYMSKYINRNVNFDMTRDLFRHLQGLPLSFFDNHSTGEHIYRINADVRAVSSFVCEAVPQIIKLFPRMIFILAIVFHLNVRLAVFAAILVPFTYIQPFLFGKWLRDINRRRIQKAQGIYKRLHEVFSHIRLVKAMGKENLEIDKFEKNIDERKKIELENARISNIGMFSGGIVNRSLSGIIVLYGGYQVIKGTITLGSYTAVMIYIAQMVGLLRSIGTFYQTAAVNSVPRNRLAEILDVKPIIYDTDDVKKYVIRRAEIEFEDVSFGYRKNNIILKNISFEIPAFSKISIVGHSGLGKTTILALILKLYGRYTGEIKIDGLDIRKMDPEFLRSQIGVAMQEPFLWNTTIRDNILYGKEDASSQDMTEAARTAEADGFIKELPNGYDSILGEMACKLSEGQKQRIAIARAVIKKPKILILDEAMSSVDSETERKIMFNLKRAFTDSTILCVSHRLSSVRGMDMVCFIEGSGAVKIGRHDELISGTESYRGLFSGQLSEMDGIKIISGTEA